MGDVMAVSKQKMRKIRFHFGVMDIDATSGMVRLSYVRA